jgi:spore coat polysaccharide biosynthesis protein SpsF
MGEQLVAANTPLLGRIFARTAGVATATEFGLNIGLNLVALKRLLPRLELHAVKIYGLA